MNYKGNTMQWPKHKNQILLNKLDKVEKCTACVHQIDLKTSNLQWEIIKSTLKENKKRWKICIKELKDEVKENKNKVQELNNEVRYLRSKEEELCRSVDVITKLQSTAEDLQELLEEMKEVKEHYALKDKQRIKCLETMWECMGLNCVAVNNFSKESCCKNRLNLRVLFSHNVLCFAIKSSKDND